MKKYIPSTDGVSMVPVYSASHQAPNIPIDPLINAPNQVMAAHTQPPFVNATYGDPDYFRVKDQSAFINSTATVQTVPVQQNDHMLQAPVSQWNRGWYQPLRVGPQGDRYPTPNLSAPDRLQSIPGYQVISTNITSQNNTIAQMYTNLRAPRMNEAYSPCGGGDGK